MRIANISHPTGSEARAAELSWTFGCSLPRRCSGLQRLIRFHLFQSRVRRLRLVLFLYSASQPPWGRRSSWQMEPTLQWFRS